MSGLEGASSLPSLISSALGRQSSPSRPSHATSNSESNISTGGWARPSLARSASSLVRGGGTGVSTYARGGARRNSSQPHVARSGWARRGSAAGLAPTFLLSGDDTVQALNPSNLSLEAQSDLERQRLLRSVSTLGKFGVPAATVGAPAEEEEVSSSQQDEQQRNGDTPPSYTTALPVPTMSSTTSRAAAKLKMLGVSALRARSTPPPRNASPPAVGAGLSPNSPVNNNVALVSPSLSAFSSITVLAEIQESPAAAAGVASADIYNTSSPVVSSTFSSYSNDTPGWRRQSAGLFFTTTTTNDAASSASSSSSIPPSSVVGRKGVTEAAAMYNLSSSQHYKPSLSAPRASVEASPLHRRFNGSNEALGTSLNTGGASTSRLSVDSRRPALLMAGLSINSAAAAAEEEQQEGMEQMISPTDVEQGSSSSSAQPRASFSGLLRPDSRRPSTDIVPKSRRSSIASRFGPSRDNLALDEDDETPSRSGERRTSSSVTGFFRKFRKSNASTASPSLTQASPADSSVSSTFNGALPSSPVPSYTEVETASSSSVALGISWFNQQQQQAQRPTMDGLPSRRSADVGPMGESFDVAVERNSWIEGVTSTSRATPTSSPSERGSANTVNTGRTSLSSYTPAIAVPLASSEGVKVDPVGELVPAPHLETPTASSSQRPSLGIDEEQAQLDMSVAVANDESTRTASASQRPVSSSGQSRSRGNARLSHLPRLDSMRIISTAFASYTGDSGDGPTQSGRDEQGRRQSQEGGGAGDESEEDTADEHEADEVEESESEVSEEDAASPSGAFATSSSRAALPPLSLPPAPAFNLPVMPTPPSPSQAVGRESWMQFADFTPFETPRPGTTAATPSGLGSGAASGSYFAHYPLPARTANGATPASDAPPPSPSVITRSRAPSSASLRSVRSTRMPLPMGLPTPNREMPPLPPVTDISLKLAAITRAKSPVRLNPLPSSSGAPMTRTGSNGDPVARGASMRAPRRPQTALADALAMPPPASTSKTSQPASATLSQRQSSRPGLYQQKSKSLIDLTSTRREALRNEPLSPAASVQASPRLPTAALPESVVKPDKLVEPKAAALRRRQSMFEVGKVPPPYSVLHRTAAGTQVIMPREEEGREKLPAYACSVHIEGYLPRKMEFSAPGVQAKDRSWRRLYFVLHGTSLKVYKTDLSSLNLAQRGAWGKIDGAHVHMEPMNEASPGTTGEKEKDKVQIAPSSSTAAAIATAASGASEKVIHTASHVTPAPSERGHPGGASGTSGINHAKEVIHNASFALSGGSNGEVKSPARNYTLQGAESGLAADYLKRRHVVRVRVEGEQFLLQTRNDRHVVDWIEGFQAATNVSLDLETRPMPKFITLPRRRRRRRREAAPTGEEAERAREAADLAEAQRRSVQDAMLGAPASARAARGSPPRPLGLPETAEPSDSFDDMLREEHEHIHRNPASNI